MTITTTMCSRHYSRFWVVVRLPTQLHKYLISQLSVVPAIRNHFQSCLCGRRPCHTVTHVDLNLLEDIHGGLLHELVGRPQHRPVDCILHNNHEQRTYFLMTFIPSISRRACNKIKFTVQGVPHFQFPKGTEERYGAKFYNATAHEHQCR